MPGEATVAAVRNAALWLESGPDGLAPLIEAVGDARPVLIGEASHDLPKTYPTGV